ncbi:serine hydrolase domain-containing protein [Runella aurantiaca]|uniref:Class A beta-lactamase-related serine hydrolase n=1 Tax=Runella aurantiaca TaxID=2282308 RepID=A0A369IJ16_9BACT|nr:serine hydrolase domain-containing protein [Runella aurantiaca]RDB07383.1 class A beta-lactamase-related serine hydrolase [Runella aurantiaca]
MKKSIFYFLLLALCACKTSETPSKQYDFSTVDTFIEENLAAYQNNIVVLVAQNGKLIYQKEVNLSAHDNRLIASASKWLSGAVIMSLVDDKKLALDDTVGSFLPIFTQYKKGHITIRQLFSHTSGFPGDSPQNYEYRANLTLAEAVDSLATYTPLLHRPGTTFNYGSVGMHIAGRIAEVVSGKLWQTLFNEKVAIPCEMSASYLLTGAKNPLIAGGVWTSAHSYLNFLEMIANKGTFNGKRILSEKSVAEMLNDQTRGAVIEGTPYPSNPYSNFPTPVVRYGIGNWLDVVNTSGNVFETSSPGLFGTHPWQDSKNNVVGIIFTKTEQKLSNATSLQLRAKIRAIIEK